MGMRKHSELDIEKRRQEIMDACLQLYKDYEFNEISLRMISEKTSLSRPSIYNYFETKEEIFFAILIAEYKKWNVQLEKIQTSHKQSLDECITAVVKSICDRELMLRIQCSHLYEIQEISRFTFLQQFKQQFFLSNDNLEKIFSKFVVKDEIVNLNEFIFPYLYGIYGFIKPTEKQLEAMKPYNYTQLSLEDRLNTYLNYL